MTDTITTEIAATNRWTPPRDGVLRDLFVFDVAVAELPDDRWTIEVVLVDGRPQDHNVFPTRAAAIRASVARLMREARTQHRTPRDLYDTNPAVGMNAKQLRVYVGWLRSVAAAEASRTQAAIERYSRGIAKAEVWIVGEETEAGVFGMEPSDPAYLRRCAAAQRKIAEFEAKLAEIRNSVETAPIAPLKRIFLGAPAAPTATIAVAPNGDGRWSQTSAVHLGVHSYDDPALDVVPTYATENAAWEAAIRRVHAFLSGIKKTSGKTLEHAHGWIDGVARMRGIDLREGPEPDLFGAAA
ncbi:hypothetical protein [Aureimonas sp. N4]|uniref:hypothetical protein n=1 Tax=Aureimonas sp. N4 TaxID=1638165 RepID=UPI000781CF56|nr:hypothetical protein [Aureimonas sp. N4]